MMASQASFFVSYPTYLIIRLLPVPHNQAHVSSFTLAAFIPMFYVKYMFSISFQNYVFGRAFLCIKLFIRNNSTRYKFHVWIDSCCSSFKIASPIYQTQINRLHINNNID